MNWILVVWMMAGGFAWGTTVERTVTADARTMIRCYGMMVASVILGPFAWAVLP